MYNILPPAVLSVHRGVVTVRTRWIWACFQLWSNRIFTKVRCIRVFGDGAARHMGWGMGGYCTTYLMILCVYVKLSTLSLSLSLSLMMFSSSSLVVKKIDLPETMIKNDRSVVFDIFTEISALERIQDWKEVHSFADHDCFWHTVRRYMPLISCRSLLQGCVNCFSTQNCRGGGVKVGPLLKTYVMSLRLNIYTSCPSTVWLYDV
jgi:hypothetical protein